MSFEVNGVSVFCSRCGIQYSKRRGNFAVHYGSLYKGGGYLTICNKCLDSIYSEYLSQCGNSKDAVRQICRKLDIYWNSKVYDSVEKKSTENTVLRAYLSRLASTTYSGKSYDNTLAEEGTLWKWNESFINKPEIETEDYEKKSEDVLLLDDIEITEDIVAFWGPGYTPSMYTALEQRRSYWMSRFPDDCDLDIGTETIIRQICSLELDINRDRAAGRAVDKSVNALNTLLGSASLKPVQKKSDADAAIYNTPMGVWIDRFEYKRPIPEDATDDEKNYFLKYILAWFGGHLSKMFGIKNANTKLYDEEIAKYRVYRPEFDDDSDDDMMYDILSDIGDNTDDLSITGGDELDDQD